MPKSPKPSCRKGRGWSVTIRGKQINLCRNRNAAIQEFYRLMREPAERQCVQAMSLAAIIDEFMLAKVYQHLTQNPQFLLDQIKKATAESTG